MDGQMLQTARRLHYGIPLTVLMLLVTLLAPVPAARAVVVCDIVCENAKPGTPQSVWDISGSGDSTIQGFATDISYNVGATARFKIKTDARAYSIDVYRLGWYGGNGARKVASVTPSVTLPQTQPACVSNTTTNLFDCGTWGVSASWPIPADAVSGVYIAKLTRPGGASHIPFIVRDDTSRAAVVFQTSDPTWQAYNTYGGGNFYTGPNGRALKLSYNRPFATRDVGGGRDFLFGNEYPLIRFMERNGYDVTYISGLDSDRLGSRLLNHKTFLSVGHDEYWSGAQRKNVEAARDAGVNLAFLSGNEVYWKTRWEPSIDGSATSNRTLVCYKETWDDAKTDPSSEWTGTWRDPRFTPPSDGGRPENALTGTAYMSNFTDLPIKVSAQEGKTRLWRGTTAATQAAGQVKSLALHTVGYESDEDLDNGFRPTGMVRLSTTTGPTPQYLRDFGTTVTPGTTTHHLTMYKAPSGALVFGAGTIQWTWGLDSNHDGEGAPADVTMQQATVNLLADMGAQPRTLMSGLRSATASTDTTAPTATITSPAAGAMRPNGTVVTVAGTANDAGGVVAGVEVSTDAGATWHPTSGTSNWTYSYVQQGLGAASIRARATDDSLNTGAVSTVAITTACPCTVFGASKPTTSDAGDGSAVELGLKFTSMANGWVTGVRFFKSAANTGAHTGSLWSTTGTLLATGSFVSETASGWQQLAFDAPVPVTTGTSYVASYFAPVGRYAADPWSFSAADVSAPPLRVPRSVTGSRNALFALGRGFPDRSFKDTNYWVDVVFDDKDTYPPTVVAQTPLAGSTSVPTATPISAVMSEDVQSSSVVATLTTAGTAVSGTTTYDAATRKVTFVPSQALDRGRTYTASVRATDLNGNAMPTPASWNFTSAKPAPAPGTCPCSIWDDATQPEILSVADAKTVELGVKFTVDVDGQVTGARFFKGPRNVGVHTGTLWSSTGVQLATATFAAESTSGWQQVSFSTPVNVVAGSTYVVSYKTTTGYYSATVNGLRQAVDNPPLHSVAGGGVFRYGGGFPDGTSSTSYLVDVVVTVPPGAAPAVKRVSPVDGDTNVPVASKVTATFSTMIQSGSAAIRVTSPTGEVAGVASYDPTTWTLNFTPSAALPPATRIDVEVSGARSLGGTAMATPHRTSFTTAGLAACPCSLFATSALPGTVDSGDGSALTLGVKVVPDVDGYVTGVRFYKSAANTGTHVGSLWSSRGTRLATATFTSESATGWQRVTFSQPVSVTAGTTYVASYHAPNGRYAADRSFYATPWSNGPLTAPGPGNGLFAYGADQFPTGSFGDTNYWVDVAFMPGQAPDTSAPTVSGRTPIDGATSVDVAMSASAVLSEPVSEASVRMTLASPTGAVAGTTTYDPLSRRATFTPGSALARGVVYTASLAATDTAGNAMTTPTTWTFTTAQPSSPPGTCPCGIWDDASQPQTITVGDQSSVELGVRFTSDRAGLVTGVRFYKGPENTGTHTGSIWSATGERLATATFVGESTTGWQTVTFAAPLTVSAGTVYVASYRAPVGRYSVTSGGLTSAVDSPPLHAMGGGGVYTYGAGFPDSATVNNYWVDPVFQDAPAG